MSQVDFAIYLPLLFWFIILFLIFYILMYIYIIPILFSTLKVKSLFFHQLIDNVYLSNLFLEINIFFQYKNFQNNIYIIMKNNYMIKYMYCWINTKRLLNDINNN